MLEVDWLKRWMMYSPNVAAIGLAETGRTFTYKEVYSFSNRLAHQLSSQFRFKRGDRVAVLSKNCFEYIILYFALQRLGLIIVPLNCRLTSREIAFVIQDCSPKLFVFQNEFQAIIDQTESDMLPLDYISISGDEKSITKMIFDESCSDDHVPIESGFDDPCQILYTSGTTGISKGAVITYGMVYWNAVNTLLRLDFNKEDVTINFLPLFHTGGWHLCLTPFLFKGAKVILMEKFNPDLVFDLCEQEKVSILFGVPTNLKRLATHERFESATLENIRFAVVGGESMPLDLIEIWHHKGIAIRQGYGLTEFGPNVFSLNEEDSIAKIGSIGHPNFFVDAKVTFGEGCELGENEIGELALRGPICMNGYWNNPEETSKVIRNGWFYTGDLVRKDSDGCFYIVGRKSDMFISGGENVFPSEVEQVIASHEAVKEVAVVGIADPDWGEVGKAFIVLNSENEEDKTENIYHYCIENLAKYKVPKFFSYVKELPKGIGGKILKQKLKGL